MRIPRSTATAYDVPSLNRAVLLEVLSLRTRPKKVRDYKYQRGRLFMFIYILMKILDSEVEFSVLFLTNLGRILD